MNFRKLATALTISTFILAVVVSIAAQSADQKPSLTKPSGSAQIIVYSDSLADNGNIYRLFGFPGPPYWNGRWSNGPVAVENMSALLGLPLLDYAYAAATTGLGNLIDGGTPQQLGSLGLPGITTAYTTTINSIPPGTIRQSLFIVYGGFNDFTASGLSTATADYAVSDLVAIVSDLQRRGARWILVPGLFDIGMSPYYTSQGSNIAAQGTYLSNYLNQKLLASLPRGVLYFDTFGLYHSMHDNPRLFGLTDVADPCYNSNTGSVCSDPNQYLFWDSIHPTEHVQVILAGGFSLAAFGFDQTTVSPQVRQ